MKKLILISLLALSALVASSQTTLSANKVIAKTSLVIIDKPITFLQVGLDTGMLADDHIVSALALKNFTVGRISAAIAALPPNTGISGLTATNVTGQQTWVISGTNTRNIALTLTKAAVGLSLVDNTSDAAKLASTDVTNKLALKANILSPIFTGVPAGPTAAPGVNTTQFATTAFVQAAVVSGGGGTLNTIQATNNTGQAWTISTPSAGVRNLSLLLNSLSVGLGNVDNTRDTSKVVSNPTLAALNLKANIASPTFTGTVGGITQAMVGLSLVNNTSDANKVMSNAALAANALNLKIGSNLADLNNIVTAKTNLGLNFVTNTTDAQKPVSTAQGVAIALKANIASPTFTGVPLTTTPSIGDSTTKIASTAFTDAAIALALTSLPTFTITNGVIAPAAAGLTPTHIGDMYVDTQAKRIYFATGTSVPGDWTAVN